MNIKNFKDTRSEKKEIIHSGPEQNQDFFLCPIKRPLAPFNIGPPESKMTKI